MSTCRFREIHVLGVLVQFRAPGAPRYMFHLGDLRERLPLSYLLSGLRQDATYASLHL